MSGARVPGDEQLHRDVLDAFDRNSNVPSAQVGVAVTDHVLTLSGTVHDVRDRVAAVDAALGVGHLGVVLDTIIVDESGTDVLADHAIATTLADLLASAPGVPAGIVFIVRDRVITMSGIADDPYERQAARRLAALVPGVNWVRDDLVVGQVCV